MSPRDLIKIAIKARENAYAPYSKFKVGASLLSKKGKVYSGCNVENASYGVTSCAERNAIYSAIASGEKDFIAMAIVADSETYCSPCGICRQVMIEFAPDIPVYMGKLNGTYCEKKVKDLLPMAFSIQGCSNQSSPKKEGEK